MCACPCWCVWRLEAGMDIFFNNAPSSDKVSPYTWSSPITLDWLVSDPQDLLGLHVHTTVPGFCIWVLEIQTRVLILVQQAFYPRSLLPRLHNAHS